MAFSVDVAWRPLLPCRDVFIQSLTQPPLSHSLSSSSSSSSSASDFLFSSSSSSSSERSWGTRQLWRPGFARVFPFLYLYLSPRFSGGSGGCLCPWKACALPAEAPSHCLRCLCVSLASSFPFGLSPAQSRVISSSVHNIYKGSRDSVSLWLLACLSLPVSST